MSSGKPRVALFTGCLVDQFYPQVGESLVVVLRRLGVEVTFDPAQTCCGQPAFNSGFRPEARQVAAGLLDLFEKAEYVVCPSGSCTSMVRAFYPELFRNDPRRLKQAEALTPRFFEFSEFLVKVLGVEDVGASFSGRVTYHDACHLLRELGVSEEPRRLIRAVRGIDFVEMKEATTCCGFGGTFSVKFPEVSVSMLADKLGAAVETRAKYLIANDSGCLMHMAGAIHREQAPIQPMHLAELLAKQE